VLVIGVSPFAVAATGDALREGLRNGTTTSETEVISDIDSTTLAKGGYSTRQSNLSDSGGGAIYGCRSRAGGSRATPPQNPCVRANNLRDGLAFEFNATAGSVAGAITVGAGGDGTRPFTTNATGVATGLNADRVDGLSASEIVTAARSRTGLDADTIDGVDSSSLVAESELLWALVDADTGAATIVRTRGAVSASTPGTGRYVVAFARDISGCGVQATLSDATGAAGPPGEISADQPSGNSVEINTYDSGGVPADMFNTDGFTVQVLC
jgi:hypothetical protein